MRACRMLLSVWCVMASAVAWANTANVPDFAHIVSVNQRAVVNISSTEIVRRAALGLDAPPGPGNPLNKFFHSLPHPNRALPRAFVTKSLGSGFIIAPDGYILTCAHVINHAKQVIVKTTNGRDYIARVVGLDTKSDVALLKIHAVGLPVVTIGQPSHLRVGDWVLAIGAPFGFDNSATAGIVSAMGRNLPGSDYVPFIQTDVPINPGNSGGPLFNVRGKVVGINSQIYSRTGGFMGLSFAIPINLAMQVGGDLKTAGRVRWAWLGVTIQNVTRKLALSFGLRKPYGALVSEVLPHGPAAHAALLAGDVIVRYDGHAIARSSELPPLVGLTPIGSVAHLKVIRNGRPESVAVTIGALPQALPTAYVKPKAHPRNQASLGLALHDLNSHEKEERGVSKGILVQGVGRGPGEKAGIRVGDVILRLAGRRVDSVRAFKALVARLPPHRPVPLLIYRNGGAVFLALSG